MVLPFPKVGLLAAGGGLQMVLRFPKVGILQESLPWEKEAPTGGISRWYLGLVIQVVFFFYLQVESPTGDGGLQLVLL